MEAFNLLRQAARDRRDSLFARARKEYETTIDRIAALEQDILGRDLSSQKSIVACVSSALPTDAPFTCDEILRNLEVIDPRRLWRKRSIDDAIARLRSKGLVRRLSKARSGGKDGAEPAVYVRAGVEVEASAFGDMPFVEVLFEVLRGRSMTATELIVHVLEAGYRSNQKPALLRDHAARAMRKDARFRMVDSRWSCRS